MSTEQIYAEFDKWWHAPEQHELRISCAKGWGFRIWQASRSELLIELPSWDSYDTTQQIISEAADRVRAAGITVKEGA